MNVTISFVKKIVHFIVLMGCVFLFPGFLCAGSADISKLVKNGGYAFTTKTGVVQFRGNELFVPASTLKILTCLAALETLGSNYRFETRFFLDQNNNLYIQGFGDPFLTSETVLHIGAELHKRGVKNLESIYLDDSKFHLLTPTPGSTNSSNPYDAPNGALVVNFNALPFILSEENRVSSGEEQTPVIPLMREIANSFSPGSYRVNVSAFDDNNISLPLRYAGELFTAQFRRTNISTNGLFLRKKTPPDIRLIYIHYSSKTLEEIIRACLKYSNNFIANQLFLACGAATSQFPATWDKSRRFMNNYLTSTLMLSSGQIRMVEGSGLSRQNNITPLAFLQILERFKPHANLLSKKDDIVLKSGTLSDVFSFAGYLHEKTLRPFVILLNQPENTREDILQLFHATFPR